METEIVPMNKRFVLVFKLTLLVYFFLLKNIEWLDVPIFN